MKVSRRRKPRAVALAIVMIVAGLGGLVAGAGTASADVDTVQGSAFGASVGGALTILPPTPTISLSADESTPPAGLGPFTNSAVDILLPGILNVPVLRTAVQAGNLAGDNHFGFMSALAEATNPTVGLNAITADVIASSCTSNGDGSVGNVQLVNLTLGGQLIATGPVAPNTTLTLPGVLTVTLNEQIRNDAPGSTSIIVRAAHIQLLPSPILPMAVLDIIIAESRCAAQGPDVLVPPTTTPPTTAPATTAPPTTSPATTAPPTTAPATTAPPTTSPATTAPPTTAPATTAPPTTSPATTAPPTTAPATTAPPTTSPATTTPPTTAPPTGTVPPTTVVTVVVSAGTLSRTGANLQPLAVLSALSLVLGVLLLIGSGRPLTAGGRGRGTTTAYAPVGRAGPEKWGPVEIAKTIWAGLAALMIALARPFGGRRK